MTTVPSIALSGGGAIPQLGFGVFQIQPAETESAIHTALEVGYRSIDTAAIYGNESEVGRAIAESGLPRNELFITTKLWNDDQGRESALPALDASLERLGLDYVDLYLIHWPAPSADRYAETWDALQEAHADGRARALGVSNFQPAQLARIIRESGLIPAVNQVELHPQFSQADLRGVHAEHGIVTEAWSPLAQAAVLDDPAIGEIARAHGRTPAQIVLRWHIELGNVAIPKSVTPARIAENFALFDFALAADEIAAISGLDRANRIGPDPDAFG
jgi:2,5-diketo-D-gluconate reductase A